MRTGADVALSKSHAFDQPAVFQKIWPAGCCQIIEKITPGHLIR